MWNYQLFYICVVYYVFYLFVFIWQVKTIFGVQIVKVQQGSRIRTENEMPSAVLKDFFLSFSAVFLA